MSIVQILETFKGNKLSKWNNYFEVYDTLFKKYQNKPIKILEIGCSQGESLQLWSKYFSNDSHIYGIDINPACKKFENDNIKVFIGDQSDTNFLHDICKSFGPFDIIIDDGSHVVTHQITSFKILFPFLTYNGLYIVEDCLSSYKHYYGGGLRYHKSFIDFSKTLVDEINLCHNDIEVNKKSIDNIYSIQYLNNLCIFEKRKDESYFVDSYGAIESTTSTDFSLIFIDKIKIKFLKFRNFLYTKLYFSRNN